MQKVMVSFPVSKGHDYEIYIGSGILNDIGSLYDFSGYSKVFIVTDKVVEPLVVERITLSLPIKTAPISLNIGEDQKNIDTVQSIWTAMHEAGCDRKSLVINIGGGVVGDIGGFAASTYMRGVDFLNVPTTLLAQVDSSVGGKTGFNFDGVKNLIGTIIQPKRVIIDPAILETLPKRQFLSGFAEVIKHGFIADEHYLTQVTAKQPLEFTKPELEDIIATSCRIKTSIVQSDVSEGGNRRLVNFGHTVGHALEILCFGTPEPLLHGEAISIGMLAEAKISQHQGLLTAEEVERVKQSLSGAGLPVTVTDIPIDRILAKMRSDKKNDNGNVNFTLLDGIGKALYNQRVEQTVVIDALQAVITTNP